MSHQRYPSHDPGKEPHSISLKVLRLSRPSLVTQHPVKPAFSPSPLFDPSVPASLAYTASGGSSAAIATADTNSDPFLLSPILNLPLSFGSAYVGEQFSCTLCANHEVQEAPSSQDATGPAAGGGGAKGGEKKQIRDVKIEAEMKTPGGGGAVHKLTLTGGKEGREGSGGVDLAPGETLQRVVDFDLKAEGNHVLAVTVSYYEATETSGRARTFRKLYQFICKSSLVVRTKVGALPGTPGGEKVRPLRRWVLEAQLENCSEDVMQLERVLLEAEQGIAWTDCNWGRHGRRPVLHRGEVEQVCFIVEEAQDSDKRPEPDEDGKIVFGVLGIGWRGEMGNRGFLSTGKLGAKASAVG